MNAPIEHSRFVRRLATLGFVALSLWAQPYRPMIFVGHSMEPTYPTYSLVMTAPRTGELRRGEVVELNTQHGRLVKRVAFLPGDQIPQYFTDGRWYDLIAITPAKTAKKLRAFRIFTVPQGKVYVLGDNYYNSTDSREYGCFPIEQVDRVILDQKPNAGPERLEVS